MWGWHLFLYLYLGKKSLITQYLQHTLRRLLFGINPIFQFSILVIIYKYIFRRWNQAMFDSTITADLILIGAGVEEANIQGFLILHFGKKYFIDVLLTVVIIIAVAGDASKFDFLVFHIPLINWQHQKLFANTPGIR